MRSMKSAVSLVTTQTVAMLMHNTKYMGIPFIERKLCAEGLEQKNLMAWENASAWRRNQQEQT